MIQHEPDPVSSLSNLLAAILPAAKAHQVLAQATSTSLLDDLPGTGTPHNQLCFAAATALSKRGLVDRGLFTMLLAFAPGQHAQIAAVALRWGIDLTLAVELARGWSMSAGREASDRTTMERVMWLSLAAAAMSAVALVAFTFLFFSQLNSLESDVRDLEGRLYELSSTVAAVDERIADLRKLQEQNEKLEESIQALRVELARQQGASAQTHEIPAPESR